MQSLLHPLLSCGTSLWCICVVSLAVPSPREIAKHEQILPWPQGLSPRGLSSKPGPSLLLAFHPYVDLGCSLTRLCSRRDRSVRGRRSYISVPHCPCEP